MCLYRCMLSLSKGYVAKMSASCYVHHLRARCHDVCVLNSRHCECILRACMCSVCFNVYMEGMLLMCPAVSVLTHSGEVLCVC
jgi:hypothetical protein